MDHDPTYQPDDEPLDERLPLLCDACGARIPDGQAIDAEGLLCEECCHPTIPSAFACTPYRGYRIDFDAKPIPDRSHDWGWAHEDFDGAEDANDHRYGYSRSLAAAKADIDEQLAELEAER